MMAEDLKGQTEKSMGGIERERNKPNGKDIFDSKPFSCTFCGKDFLLKAYLTCHLKIHDSERPFSCDICDKKFSQKSDLNKHKEIHTNTESSDISREKSESESHTQTHVNENPHRCGDCGLHFPDNSTFISHIIQSHPWSQAQEYKCDICGENFSAKHDLKIHIICVHIDAKPYSCEFCKKRFKSKAGLSTHVHNSHKKVSQYSCNICKKQFRWKNLLNHHYETHGVKQEPNHDEYETRTNKKQESSCMKHDSHAGMQEYSRVKEENHAIKQESSHVKRAENEEKIAVKKGLADTNSKWNPNRRVIIKRLWVQNNNLIFEEKNQEEQFVQIRFSANENIIELSSLNVENSHSGKKSKCYRCGQKLDSFFELMGHLTEHMLFTEDFIK